MMEWVVKLLKLPGMRNGRKTSCGQGERSWQSSKGQSPSDREVEVHIRRASFRRCFSPREFLTIKMPPRKVGASKGEGVAFWAFQTFPHISCNIYPTACFCVWWVNHR